MHSRIYSLTKQPQHSVDNLLELFGGIENTFLDNNVRQSIKKTKDRFIIDIDTNDISSLDFNLPPEKLDFLKSQGMKSTMEFFSEDYDDKQSCEQIDGKLVEIVNNDGFMGKLYSFLEKFKFW